MKSVFIARKTIFVRLSEKIFLPLGLTDDDSEGDILLLPTIGFGFARSGCSWGFGFGPKWLKWSLYYSIWKWNLRVADTMIHRTTLLPSIQ